LDLPAGGVTVARWSAVDLSGEFTPRAEGSVTATLVFYSAPSEDGDPSQVALLGTAGTFALISVTPRSYDFGILPLRASRTVTFIVTNSGQSSLIIERVDIDGDAEFQIAASPPLRQPIPAGERHTLTIRFDPRDEGVYSADITIISNAHNEALSTVRGTCRERGPRP
jgi:Protein of unknown function (DUF1573)